MLLPSEWILARVSTDLDHFTTARAVGHGLIPHVLNGRSLCWRWSKFEGYRCLSFADTGVSIVVEPRQLLGLPRVALETLSTAATEVPDVTFGRQPVAALALPQDSNVLSQCSIYVLHDVLRMEVIFIVVEQSVAARTTARVHVTEAQFGEVK